MLFFGCLNKISQFLQVAQAWTKILHILSEMKISYFIIKVLFYCIRRYALYNM
jgi:hypothetical protein